MNISFDLDSTIIPNGDEFETEKRNIVIRLLGAEKIRKGTFALFTELKARRHRIHIDTTSFRSAFQIRKSLICYGIRVDRIISQNQNQKMLKSLNINASKYPPAFKFDLLIDDSRGVSIKAKRLHFEAFIIETSDKTWYDTIIRQIERRQNF